MTYGDFTDWPRRTASDKVWHDKAINIAKTPTCDEYQKGLALKVYKLLDKKSVGCAASCARSETLDTCDKFAIKSKTIPSQELAVT